MIESTDATTRSSLNLATIVFAAFSLLSLVACFIKGIVPIYFFESLAWGALAWYMHKKVAITPTVNLIAILLAVCVAAAEGYSVGQSTAYKAAYETGRKAGTQSGYELGKSIGEASGYSSCLACVSGVEKACSRNPK